LADDTVTPTPMTRDTGAPPNEHDPRGFTPLILAAYHGQVQEVDFLIAEGAAAARPNNGREYCPQSPAR
jgi:hypothetical protein